MVIYQKENLCNAQCHERINYKFSVDFLLLSCLIPLFGLRILIEALDFKRFVDILCYNQTFCQ